jgi:hypothetical protein
MPSGVAGRVRPHRRPQCREDRPVRRVPAGTQRPYASPPPGSARLPSASTSEAERALARSSASREGTRAGRQGLPQLLQEQQW